MLPAKLIKTTAAIYKNENFVGSGILFLDHDNLFFLTVAHNIYGKKFDQVFDASIWRIRDYNGTFHSIFSTNADRDFSVENDVALLRVNCSTSLEEFTNIYFAPMPNSRSAELFVRGFYGTKAEPVTKPGIHFLEVYKPKANQFLATISKEQLSNKSFSFGNEWLSGLSGSGLFLSDRKETICAGILQEIPDKGDNGQILFISVEVLASIGLEIKTMPSAIYNFNPDFFSDQWFRESLESSIDMLGKRYSPKLNFDLPIGQVANGLSRDTIFKAQLENSLAQIYKKRRMCYRAFNHTFLSSQAEQIESLLIELKQQYLTEDIIGFAKINFDGLSTTCNQIKQVLSDYQKGLYEEQRKAESIKPTPRHSTPPFQGEMYEIRELTNAVFEFLRFITGQICKVANNPFIILKGEAGFGKSHLLGDIVRKRDGLGLKSILFLGHRFVTDENPWIQILKQQMNVAISADDFLNQLNLLAAFSGERIILVIDAINEGNGKAFWRDHLRSFFQKIRRFDGLGLIVSIRTSYYDLLVDKSIIDDGLAVGITHYGFTDHEYDASDFFFDNYGIKKPSIPFLHPEFRSPLFLKLFCDGLSARGLIEIPPGYEGISAVSGFFLDAINFKLSRILRYDDKFKIVEKAVNAFSEEIIKTNTGYLAYDETGILFSDLPEAKLMQSPGMLVQSLVEEGVLAKNLFPLGQGKYQEGLYFLYERFFDHITASVLIKSIAGDVDNAFCEGGVLHTYFQDELSCSQNLGLIEALSIQIPEKYGKELFEYIPSISEYEVIARSLINSIVWRSASSFSSTHLDVFEDYLDQVAFEVHDLSGMFLNNVILISAIPGHPFNIEYLHKNLINQEMSHRDSQFLLWIDWNWSSDGSEIRRLIDWAWKDINRDNLSDESLLLSSVTISWFLISPNRNVRDSATKAIVCLLQYREHLIVELLKHFQNVNDPYIYERLFCVAYGVTIRAKKHYFLASLCTYIYNQIFNQPYVYPHVLLRDYAKSIIEYADECGQMLPFDIEITRPPYRSLPIQDFPTTEDIDATYELDSQSHIYSSYQNQILESMTTEYGRGISGYGNFGRYTFQSALSDWDVDVIGLSNYGVKRIFEMGYNLDLHGKYERNRNSGNGDERIGKKYQWIVLHEILARVADNEVMRDEIDQDNIIRYQGAWQPHVKDIDPSVILRKKGRSDDLSVSKSCWWVPKNRCKWESSNAEWLELLDDIPDPCESIAVVGADGVDWINLEMSISFANDPDIGEDKYQSPTKDFWQQVRAFIVPNERFNKFKDWAEKWDFYDVHVPDPSYMTQVFSREYYWSECYEFHQQPYYGGSGDVEVENWKTGRYISDLHLPAQYMLWEKGKDFSILDTISFYRPSTKLFEGINMSFGHREGELCDSKGELVCFDPSVNSTGTSCLLIRKDSLLSYLKENELSVCWLVWGEKRIIGGRDDSQKRAGYRFNKLYYFEGENLVGIPAQ